MRFRSEPRRAAASVLGALAWCVSGAASALPITVDGAADVEGVLPWVAFGAWEGNDGYPIGPGFRVTGLGLYDTGSTSVAVSPLAADYLSNNAGLQSPVDLRINGLQQVDPTTLAGPWGVSSASEGGSVPASLEVQGVNLNIDASIPLTGLPIPGSENVLAVQPSLLGAPVANQSIALIDYTSPVSIGFFGAVIESVAIDFFDGGSAPLTELVLGLSRFGNVGVIDGSDRGQRYNLDGVTFTNGSASASGSYFYDTGTTVTLINNSLAGLLGISSGVTPSFNCALGIGVQVDSFVAAGIGGDYTVNNAQLCWVQSDDPFAGSNAIIGSNLFSQVPVLFDGINNTLGIGIAAATPVPEPGTLTLLLAGLVACLVRRRR
jgi:hypothetical protein